MKLGLATSGVALVLHAAWCQAADPAAATPTVSAAPSAAPAPAPVTPTAPLPVAAQAPAAAPAPVAPTASVSTAAAPAPGTAAPPEDDYQSHDRSSFDMGGHYFGDTAGTNSSGFALEVNNVFPVSGRWGVGLRLAWGFTEFERFERWAKVGYKVGKWTTTAYADVARWSVKKDGYELYKVFGSIFVYVVLAVPLMVSGFCYMAAVLAPTTDLETALTLNYDFGDRAISPYVEGGLGFLAYFHPTYGQLRFGMGPSLGSGIRLGPVRVGAHVTWSPSHLHGEASGRVTDLFVGGLTVGITSH